MRRKTVRRLYRVVSVLCCLIMLLSWLPEKAKASPDVTIKDIANVTFDDFFGGYVECHATESHNYEMTYSWIGGPTKDLSSMSALNCLDQWSDNPKTIA